MAKKTKELTLAEFQEVLTEMQGNVEKFNKGVQAAGARIRKGAQQLKVLAQTLRNDVTAIKNSR